MQNLLQNDQYEPAPPDQRSFNLSDFMAAQQQNQQPSPAPEQQNPGMAALDQFRSTPPIDYEALINDQRKRSELSEERIAKLSKDANYDPIKVASDKYKDLYKWKGVSTARKLGSIGYGVLDALSQFSGDHKNVHDKIQERELLRHHTISGTAEREISQNRQLQNNANTNMTILAGQSTRTQLETQKFQTANELRLVLAKMTDKQASNKLALEASKALADGDLKKAQAILLDAKTDSEKAGIATKGVPTNLTQTSVMESQGALPAGTTAAAAKANKDSKGDPAPGAGMQFFKLGEKNVVVKDALTGEYRTEPTTDFMRGNKGTGVVTPVTDNRGGRAVLDPAQKKQLDQFNSAVGTLGLGTQTMLNDISSGRAKSYTGLMSHPGIAAMQNVFSNDPNLQVALKTEPQRAAFAMMDHAKAVYGGGRIPMEFINHVEKLMTGKGGTEAAMSAALMSQYYLSQMRVIELAQDQPAVARLQDPAFLNFLTSTMASQIKIAQGGKTAKLMKLTDVFSQYDQFKAIRAGDKGTFANPEDQKKRNATAEMMKAITGGQK